MKRKPLAVAESERLSIIEVAGANTMRNYRQCLIDAAFGHDVSLDDVIEAHVSIVVEGCKSIRQAAKKLGMNHRSLGKMLDYYDNGAQPSGRNRYRAARKKKRIVEGGDEAMP